MHFIAVTAFRAKEQVDPIRPRVLSQQRPDGAYWFYASVCVCVFACMCFWVRRLKRKEGLANEREYRPRLTGVYRWQRPACPHDLPNRIRDPPRRLCVSSINMNSASPYILMIASVHLPSIVIINNNPVSVIHFFFTYNIYRSLVIIIKRLPEMLCLANISF